MGSNYKDIENYCKDCSRRIYGEHPSCDINIENDGKYTMHGTPCGCKVDIPDNDGFEPCDIEETPFGGNDYGKNN